MLGVRTKPAAARVPGQEWGRADGQPDSERREDARWHDDEWLATLAHELRSPLATVLSALEVIAGGELDPAASRARDVAGRQARQAMQLVEDLFDLCAGSLDRLHFRNEVVDA